MIVDHISNRSLYYSLGEDYKKALDYFAGINTDSAEKCNVPLDSRVIVKVRPMMTKPASECSFEAHKHHADIHFVAYGEEKIGYAEVGSLKETSYNPDTDAAALEGQGDLITLRQGFFMITLPQDAHMPCVCVSAPVRLGKMIAKIPTDK